MKFKNISQKVIGIDGHYVMPDAELEISKKTAELAAIQSYVSLGLAVLEESEAVSRRPAPSAPRATAKADAAKVKADAEPVKKETASKE